MGTGSMAGYRARARRGRRSLVVGVVGSLLALVAVAAPASAEPPAPPAPEPTVSWPAPDLDVPTHGSSSSTDRSAPAAEVEYGEYHAVEPARILDTRTGVNTPIRPLRGGQTLPILIDGEGGVPAGMPSAVVLNVTVTDPTAPAFLAVFPDDGTGVPLVSNLNFSPGQTVANLVTVPVADNGYVRAFLNAGSADVVVDVFGWYDIDGTGARFNPVRPGRVLDTRTGIGGPQAPFGTGTVRRVQVGGLHGVPSSGVSAVALNLTVDGASVPSYLTAWANGTHQPYASNINFVGGDVRANLAVVPVDAQGRIQLYNYVGSVSVIADVVGWYDASGTEGGMLLPVTPTRIIDTREIPGGRLGPNTIGEIDFSGFLPDEVLGFVLNVTGVQASQRTFVTVYPGPGSPPNASNLNPAAGDIVPNQVMVPLGPNDTVDVYNAFGSIDILVDVFGFFVTSFPEPPPT